MYICILCSILRSTLCIFIIMYLGTVIQTFDFLLSKIFASLVHNLVGGGGGGGNGEDFALEVAHEVLLCSLLSSSNNGDN